MFGTKQSFRIIIGLKKNQSCRPIWEKFDVLTFPCIVLILRKLKLHLFKNNSTIYTWNLRKKTTFNRFYVIHHFTKSHQQYNARKLFNKQPVPLKRTKFITQKKKMSKF